MKTLLPFTLIFLGAILFTSCAHEKSAAYAYGDTGGSSFSSDKYYEQEQSGKRVIYTSSIDLTVKIPDSTSLQIESIAKKYNGYVQNSGTTSCTIRVEEKSYKMAVEEICMLGKVENKHMYGQDVSEEYADYAVRLDNAEKARMRYLELLEKAENVQAALLVEKELERLNETIELMKGKMNRIDHLTAYSTITVYLKEKKKPGLVGYVGIGLYKAVKWLFVRN